MNATQIRPEHNVREPATAPWKHSETLFLLTCYDVWSATPARGCQCTEAVAPPNQRARQLSLQFI